MSQTGSKFNPQVTLKGKAAPFAAVPNFVQIEVLGERTEVKIPLGALSDEEINRLCRDWVARVIANAARQRHEAAQPNPDLICPTK